MPAWIPGIVVALLADAVADFPVNVRGDGVNYCGSATSNPIGANHLMVATAVIDTAIVIDVVVGTSVVGLRHVIVAVALLSSS